MKEITFVELSDVWLKNLVVSNINKKTEKQYAMISQEYFNYYFGDILVNDITPEIIDTVIRRIREKKKNKETDFSGTTQNYYLKVLNMIFNYGVNNQLMNENPAKNKKIKKNQKRIIVLSNADLKKFLNEIREDKYFDVIEFALLTGARLSEILGLRWSDIEINESEINGNNLKNGTVHFNQQMKNTNPENNEALLIDLKNRIWLDKLKTTNSNRKINISRKTIELLENIKNNQNEIKNKYNFVFINNRGMPLKTNDVSKQFTKIKRNSFIKEYTYSFHSLRHQFASNMLNGLKKGDVIINPVSIAQVSKYLGHSSIRTTIDAYAHLMTNDVQNIYECIDEFY